jgi:cystathionine gamma-synthase
VPIAKQFWQHTGSGISSRMADRCLYYVDQPTPAATPQQADSTSSSVSDLPRQKSNRGMSRNRHYAKDTVPSISGSPTLLQTQTNGGGDSSEEQLSRDFDLYVEERYGRNLSLASAPLAKSALRRRIAGVLKEDPSASTDVPIARSDSQAERQLREALSQPSLHGASDRGVKDLDQDDVYLYPGGMSSIWHAHQLVMKTRESQGGAVGKSICFG